MMCVISRSQNHVYAWLCATKDSHFWQFRFYFRALFLFVLHLYLSNQPVKRHKAVRCC